MSGEVKKLCATEIADMYGISISVINRRLKAKKVKRDIERRRIVAPQTHPVYVYSEKDVLEIFGEVPE